VPFRQIFVVLVALIAIVGAGLFVLSWEGDDDADTTADPDTGANGAGDGEVGEGEAADATTTTTVPAVTTTIPVSCGPTEGEAAATSTTVTTPTTLAEGEDPGPVAPQFPTLSERSSLSTVGLDEVTFGLTVNQASIAAGTEFHACGPVSDCYRVTPAEAPEGISFVVFAGTIERVDIVGESPITTVSGAGIGTTVDELDELFGDNLERTDLGGGAVDVVFVPTSENDAEFRVAFTTVDGIVETMRAGRMPLVLEAEPCA
jgi:hypothetical protein